MWVVEENEGAQRDPLETGLPDKAHFPPAMKNVSFHLWAM